MWEYRVVNILPIQESPEKLEPYLKGFGAQGWELVTMRFSYAVFKRETPEGNGEPEEPPPPPEEPEKPGKGPKPK